MYKYYRNRLQAYRIIANVSKISSSVVNNGFQDLYSRKSHKLSFFLLQTSCSVCVCLSFQVALWFVDCLLMSLSFHIILLLFLLFQAYSRIFRKQTQNQKIFIQIGTIQKCLPKALINRQHFQIRVILVASSKCSLPCRVKNLARNSVDASFKI